MFDGFEVDVLSLGDADSILISEWSGYTVTRALIDGGKESDFPEVKEFLQSRRVTELQHVLCSHLHDDHAAGLIKLVQDPSFTIRAGWMHNIRNHVDSDRLRRASVGNSSDAAGVRQVLQNTDQLLSSFFGRGITPMEPFTGAAPAILGPSRTYYARVIAEFTKVSIQMPPKPRAAYGSPGLLAALAGVGPSVQPQTVPFFTPPTGSNPALYSALYRLAGPVRTTGPLSRAAVKENPSTQPFNNTSVILGLNFKGYKFLFTADAGCEALRQVGSGWENLYGLQVPHHGSDGNLSKDLIQRFKPQIAYISACGDESHPSPAVKNALITVGARVFSTHYPSPGHLRFTVGNVPSQPNYCPATPMKGPGALPLRGTRLIG